MTKTIFGACSVCLALAVTASAQVPAGGEFRVNDYTTGVQRAARIAMEPDGDFVVVWEGSAGDGDSYGSFGQRFAASGAPRGSEFQINTYTTGVQIRPAVAVGRRGDFVVVWGGVQEGSGLGIEGRRYDAAGAAIAGEFLVNTFTTGNQDRPNVGRASDGAFVVTWVSPNVDGSSAGIAARRFDPAGAPIGNEFGVNTYTTGSQLFADLAVEDGGAFTVVWEEEFGNHRDGSGASIFAQRYDAAGVRVGSEFQVNAYTTGNQRLPSVSASPAGGFVAPGPAPGTETAMDSSCGASTPLEARWGTMSSSTRTPPATRLDSSERWPTTHAAISS